MNYAFVAIWWMSVLCKPVRKMLMAHIAEISWRSILYAIEARNVYMCNQLIDCQRRKSVNRKWPVS